MRVLSVQHISKLFGSRLNRVAALSDLSFEVQEGEFVGIMGPSGAGKTTLLNLIATVEAPTTGDIFVGGKRLNDLGDAASADFRRESLGFIFQALNLMPDLTVEDNIALPLTLAKRAPQKLHERVVEAARAVSIDDLLARYPDELSIGQQQRVATARALIVKPSLILADEPTGSLDSQAATNLLKTLQNLNEQTDTTILMVTHDAFTASFCNRIIFIRDGSYFAEVTRRGSRQQFFESIIDMEARINGGGRGYAQSPQA